MLYSPQNERFFIFFSSQPFSPFLASFSRILALRYCFFGWLNVEPGEGQDADLRSNQESGNLPGREGRYGPRDCARHGGTQYWSGARIAQWQIGWDFFRARFDEARGSGKLRSPLYLPCRGYDGKSAHRQHERRAGRLYGSNAAA